MWDRRSCSSSAALTAVQGRETVKLRGSDVIEGISSIPVGMQDAGTKLSHCLSIHSRCEQQAKGINQQHVMYDVGASEHCDVTLCYAAQP